jgi:hypothetical protein
MWVGGIDSSGSAVISKQRSQTSGCHTLPAGGSFQRNEKCSAARIGPFQPHVVFEQLNGFWSQREKSQLVSLAANAQLPFGEQHVVRVQGQDLR